MMKAALLLTLLLLGSTCGYGQSGTWARQAPIPSGKRIPGIAVRGAHQITAVTGNLFGAAGEVVQTTDGGRNWSTQQLPTNQLNAIQFHDANLGWAGGNGLYRTTDGGQTWTQSNNFGTVQDLFFVDAQNGWACANGAVVYRTTNGGVSWMTGQSVGGPSTLSSIWFVDPNLGFTVGIGGEIFRTQDGGMTWTMVANLPGGYLSTVQFFDALEGWAIGGNFFLHTTDGGTTWNQVAVPANTWSHAARFATRLHGVSVGQGGNIILTRDGGQTWTVVRPDGAGQLLWDVEFFDEFVGFASGESGALIETADGGASWQSIQNGTDGITYALSALDERTAWASSMFGEVFATSDGGRRWERYGVDGFDRFGRVLGVHFSDPSNGWACGRAETFVLFPVTYGRISRSTDGGKTWSLSLQIQDFEYRDVYALDAMSAVAVGASIVAGPQSSVAVRTDDGGATWYGIAPPSAGLRAVFFLDGLTGWAVGDRVFKTVDGGLSWVQQLQTTPQFTDVEFADAQNGWVVGFSGQVFHTTNGGTTWQAQPVAAPPGAAITGVSVLDASTAVIAGWNGFVARTTDGGVTWQTETLPGPTGTGAQTHECVRFVTSQVGFVAGNDGIWQRRAPQSTIASFSTFGGTTQSARLLPRADLPPILGANFGVNIAGIPTGGSAWLALGLSDSFSALGALPFSVPLATGIGRVLVSPEFFLTATSTGPNTAEILLPIPNVPSAASAIFFAQAVVFDGFFSVTSLSNAGEGVLGNQ